MAGSQCAVFDMAADTFRQRQQADGVGDMAAALADRISELLLRIAELIHQLLIGARFFQRIEVGALDILDQRDLQRLAVGKIADQHRHLVHAGALSRAPAPFAGDDFELAIAALAHHQRLQQTLVADRAGQIFEITVGEMLARIIRIGMQELDRNMAQRACILDDRFFRRVIADEGREPPTQPAFLWLCHHHTSRRRESKY